MPPATIAIIRHNFMKILPPIAPKGVRRMGSGNSCVQGSIGEFELQNDVKSASCICANIFSAIVFA